MDAFEPALKGVSLPELRRRHVVTQNLWARLRTMQSAWDALSDRESDKKDVPHLKDRSCVFVAGSMARGEAIETSDLDIFVIDDLIPNAEIRELVTGDHPKPDNLNRLNFVETSILISTLDEVRRGAGFEPFSRGGEFARPLSLQRIVDLTGAPSDDAENTFTTRMLLMLESRPLFNPEVYNEARSRVLDRYWARRPEDQLFMPIMLLNDIRRWWGVLALNFELYNKRSSDDNKDGPDPRRDLANLKLRYSRLMTCYTPVLGMLKRSTRDGILRSDLEEVLDKTPAERLAEIYADGAPVTKDAVADVITAYDRYLALSASPADEQIKLMESDKSRRRIKDNAYKFHGRFMQLFALVGAGKPLYDYCVL